MSTPGRPHGELPPGTARGAEAAAGGGRPATGELPFGIAAHDPGATPRLLSGQAAEPHRVEQFLRYEAYLLDHGRFTDWLALYAADAHYWVPLEAGQPDPFLTQSIIYDDKRLMEIRVRQQSHPRAHSRLPLARTVHQVGNVLLLETPDDRHLTVASTLVLAEYRRERQRVYAANVTHCLRRQGESYEIAYKRVDLINSESDLDGIAFLF